MRYSRQNKILEIISKKEIESQEVLVTELKHAGFNVTQSTISRDIKELNLIKVKSASGTYKYALDNNQGNNWSERFKNILRQTVTSYVPAENLIVIKTLSGCGNAVGEALDNIGLEHTLGCVAGDNTLLLVVDKKENIPKIISCFDKIIRRNK